MTEQTIEHLMPDVAARLRAGGRVADIGWGAWRSGIELAQEFPRVSVDAVDTNQAAVEQASWAAGRAGVGGRVVFHVAHPRTRRSRGRTTWWPAWKIMTISRTRCARSDACASSPAPAAPCWWRRPKADTLIDTVYVRAAGFSHVDVLPGDETAHHFFRLTP
jgi:hypothetical protein